MIEPAVKDELRGVLAAAEADVRAIEALLLRDAACLELLARIARAASRLDDAATTLLEAHSAYCVSRLRAHEPAYAGDLLDAVRHYRRLH